MLCEINYKARSLLAEQLVNGINKSPKIIDFLADARSAKIVWIYLGEAFCSCYQLFHPMGDPSYAFIALF